MNTIKNLRNQIDMGLISPNEAIGQQVKVGFMFLNVTGYEPTPNDGLPNIWHLESNGKAYNFTPYNGLERV